MAISSMLSGIGSSIIGSPKKAVLILHKDSGEAINSQEIANQTESMLALTSATTNAFALKALFVGSPFHLLQVQYNPSSIKISANAESVPFQYLQQNVDNGIPNQNHRPPSIVLTVDLIFDAVNVKDAFMLEKLRLSAGDAVSAVAGIAKSLKGGYTVQPQTNGLIAMLMRDSTRTVTFKWADMTFTGEATEIQAKYTMFSVSGKPVRSVVTISITQQVDSKADSTYWDKAFDKCFGDAGSTMSCGGKGIGQTAGNLLNVAF